MFGGSRLAELHESIPQEVTDSNADTNYLKAINRLNNYFNPKRNVFFEDYVFSKAKQEENETIESYVARLKVLARSCEYTAEDREIVKHVIKTCRSSKLRGKLLEDENLDLAKVIKYGRTHDNVKAQVKFYEGKDDSVVENNKL